MSYTFTAPAQEGPCWIEAEVQWPDGRRAFATNTSIVSVNAPPLLSNPQAITGGLSFTLTGTSRATYVILSSTNLLTWQNFSTNVLPASGVTLIADSNALAFRRRYYRAVKTQ